MKTLFNTGPGFYGASTCKVDKTIPPGVTVAYCARLEAYELSPGTDHDDINFTVLFSMAENNPKVARALLGLGAAIHANAEQLQEICKNG